MSVRDLITYPKLANIVQDYVDLKDGKTRHAMSLRGMLTKLFKVTPPPNKEQVRELLTPIESLILDDIKSKLELSQLSILNQDLVWLRDTGFLTDNIINLINSYKRNIVKKILEIIKEGGIKKGYAFIDVLYYNGIGLDWKEFDIISDSYKAAIKTPISEADDSLRRFFGGREHNIITDMGFNFFEKVSYFSSLTDDIKYHIPKSKLPAINRALGRQLKIRYLEDVLKPLPIRLSRSLANMHDDQAFIPMGEIVDDSDKVYDTVILVAKKDDPRRFSEYKKGDMFLANKNGKLANYFRMWAKLV